jgi:conjugal transfer ATP-binding protein TraC
MDDRPAAMSTGLGERVRAGLRSLADRWMHEEPPIARVARKSVPLTLAQQRKLLDGAQLSQFLSYESHDERNLYHNTDTVGFLLECSPAAGLDEAKLNVLTGLLTQGIRNHSVIQISLYGDPDIHGLLDYWRAAGDALPGAQGDALRTLARKRVDYLREGAWASLFPDQPMLVRNWRLLISFTRPRIPGSTLDGTELEYLTRTRAAFRSTLQSAGIGSTDIAPDALLRLADGLLNPTKSIRPVLRHDPNVPLRRQVTDRDSLMVVGRDALGTEHDGFHVTPIPYSVRQYPTDWAGWANGELLGALMNNVLRLPCPVLLTQTIYAADQVEAQNGAKLKAARATQMVDAPVGKYVPVWKDRKRDSDYVVRKLGEGHKLLQGHFQVIAYAPHGEEDYCEQKLRAIFDSRGWALQKDRYSTLHAFRSALPMGMGPALIREMKKLGYFRTMLTWNCINTAPLIGEWKGTVRPLMLLLGRKGQIQYFDPFDNTKGNFNCAMAAAPGAGKSFYTQEMIQRTLATGGRVWTLDSGESYRNLSELFGGTYIKFDKQRNPVINPFSGINATDFDSDELPQLKQILAKMASPEVPLDSLHLSYLEAAIRKAWHEHGNKTEITEVAAVLAASPRREQKNLAVMLEPWTRAGSYGRYFTGPSNIDLDNRFVVLEMSDLDSRPDLQGVVLMILMHRITELMYHGDRSQRKLCIIDEAWRLLGNGNAGAFVEAGYRTARKYGGAFVTVTQGIDDYYESASAKAALACSDWVLLLRQKPESLAAAADNKRIFVDDGARELLMSLDTIQGQYSEIAIRGPSGLSISRLVVDRFSEKLYSTKADEFQFVRDQMARGLRIDQAVEALVQRTVH